MRSSSSHWSHAVARRTRSAPAAFRRGRCGTRSVRSWKVGAKPSSSGTAVSPWRPPMYDSPEELLGKIRLGEDTSLELKAVDFRGQRVNEPARDDLADEIAAIANTRDGVLVLGVGDKTREILGIPVERLDAVERFVFEICTDSIKPPVVFRTFRMELPDSVGTLRPVIKVEIPRSLFVP